MCVCDLIQFGLCEFNRTSSSSICYSLLSDRIVPDGVVTLETDEGGHHVLDASGTVYRNIDLDLDGEGQLDRQGALTSCLRHNFDEDLRGSISHTKVINLQHNITT